MIISVTNKKISENTELAKKIKNELIKIHHKFPAMTKHTKLELKIETNKEKMVEIKAVLLCKIGKYPNIFCHSKDRSIIKAIHSISPKIIRQLEKERNKHE